MNCCLRLVAATVLFAGGCAHLPLTCPGQGGARWSELTTRHFVLRTDLPRGEAREALADFERSYAAFESLVFPSGDPRRAPRGRIDFVLFRHEEDFRMLAPSGASGYFLSHPNDDVEESPTIAMHGERLATTHRRFQHELTHRFLADRLRQAPPWLEEGFAEFYSTFETGFGEATIGELPVKRVLATDIKLRGALSARVVEQRVMIEDVPPLAELLAADYATFHDERRELQFYVGAWALVHMLESSSFDLRRRFRGLVEDLARGAPASEAWPARFGDLSAAALGEQFRRYLLRGEMDYRRAAFRTPEPPPPEQERTLSDAEVHLLWARVRPWNCRENILRAGQDLRAAIDAGPPSAEVLYWKSLYDLRWRRFEEAERDLARALQARPDEARYWHALAALRDRTARLEPEHRLGSTEEALARLAPLARSPWALNFLARWYGERGQLEAGLAYARRAVDAGPGCWECIDTYTELRGLEQHRTAPPPEGPARSVL